MNRCTQALCFALALGPTAGAAADLCGDWEMQTMGTDRTVTVQQRGQKLAIHRVMWPSFEGKKYKLEHLFRGTIKGQRVSGDLFVRDDEAPQYESLRAFDGKVVGATAMVIDGIDLKRRAQSTSGSAKAPAAAKPPPPSPSPVATAPTRPTASEKATPQPEPPVAIKPSSTVAKPPPATAKAKGPDLLDMKVRPAIGAMAKKFARLGDEAYAAGDFDEALSMYRRAARAARGMPAVMLHRMGRAHLALEEYGQAYKWLYRALRKDPTNAGMRREFETAKLKR